MVEVEVLAQHLDHMVQVPDLADLVVEQVQVLVEQVKQHHQLHHRPLSLLILMEKVIKMLVEPAIVILDLEEEDPEDLVVTQIPTRQELVVVLVEKVNHSLLFLDHYFHQCPHRGRVL
jgi:hypothetical protein